MLLSASWGIGGREGAVVCFLCSGWICSMYNNATRMRQNSLSDEPPANRVPYRQKALDETKKPVEA